MAWTAPMTAIAGSVFTAAQFNQFVRDNLAETAPAKATTPGGYFVTTATNQIAERSGAIATQLTNDSTTSTSYTDLDTTTGPSLTVATSNCAVVIISASISNTANVSARMAYEVSGASAIAPADNRGVATFGVAGVGIVAANVLFHNDLTAGSNTFTAKYRVAGGTGSFTSRRITVLPL
ncbi:hypothetical protein [Streptomyces africanus]|uniref:hypothetical protein n=1 Tax=Streptomyces africanus TaxID=231024 RepID=UPI0011801A47|nr:hypothetical protein [Streptomyces africanus]